MRTVFNSPVLLFDCFTPGQSAHWRRFGSIAATEHASRSVSLPLRRTPMRLRIFLQAFAILAFIVASGSSQGQKPENDAKKAELDSHFLRFANKDHVELK